MHRSLTQTDVAARAHGSCAGLQGLGDNGDRESFQPVQAVFHKTFASVDCGEAHSVAVTAEGEVYVWGSNTRQQLCNQDCSAQSNTPMLLSVPDTGSPVVRIHAPHVHSLLLYRFANGLARVGLFAWAEALDGSLHATTTHTAVRSVNDKVRHPTTLCL